MVQQRHIINEQIIEMHIPETSDAFAMQQTLGRLYREQLVPVIDKQLTDRYGNDEKCHYRIDTLTIDLGEVQLEDIATVFTEKLARVLSSDEAPEPLKEQEQPEEVLKPDETPLKVLSHYLTTGILPWWSGDATKAYLFEQLEALLETPDATFKALLGQLRHNGTYLNRFLNTFTEEQVLRSLQFLTTIPVKEALSETKNKFVALIRKNPDKQARELREFSMTKALWTAVFQQVSTAGDYPELERRAVYQALQILDIDPNATEKWLSPVQERTGSGKETTKTPLPEIRSLAENLKIKYPENAVWQQFFHQFSKMLHHPSVHLVNSRLLKGIKQLLADLDTAQRESVQWQDQQKQHAAGEGSDSATRLKTATKANLQPLAKHLHVLETSLRQLQSAHRSNVMEKLQSGFEDTDFISVQNAGLVILWPFLQRFFENVDLIEAKVFRDEAARNKAACALQYLSKEDEEGLFEGMLTLNKVLCGIPPEATIEPILLSADEKATAEGLLYSVIARGPHWKNLSPDGFRTSYLQREGLLRARDDHWLLQVKKETYDVTLEKLPWGFAAVKLPWMQDPLMVEWI